MKVEEDMDTTKGKQNLITFRWVLRIVLTRVSRYKSLTIQSPMHVPDVESTIRASVTSGLIFASIARRKGITSMIVQKRRRMKPNTPLPHMEGFTP